LRVYFAYMWAKTLGGLSPIFGRRHPRRIVCFKFGDDWFRGLV